MRKLILTAALLLGFCATPQARPTEEYEMAREAERAQAAQQPLMPPTVQLPQPWMQPITPQTVWGVPAWLRDMLLGFWGLKP